MQTNPYFQNSSIILVYIRCIVTHQYTNNGGLTCTDNLHDRIHSEPICVQSTYNVDSLVQDYSISSANAV